MYDNKFINLTYRAAYICRVLEMELHEAWTLIIRKDVLMLTTRTILLRVCKANKKLSVIADLTISTL
jgi:hypothetical protein